CRMNETQWQNIHLRLAEIKEKQSQHEIPDSPSLNQKQILNERARRLAKIETYEEEKELPLEVVEFRLGNEIYALECNYVKEVLHLKLLLPIPGTPAFVLGIINIRGQIISVIDLMKFFDININDLKQSQWIIVLENKNMELAVTADELLGVTTIPIKEIQPALPTLVGVCAEYLKGISKKRSIILDALKILKDEKIIVNQE
ncbi:MAG: chemotaxis protein CheW, partial [Acidobacteria bacterium]|nr:chemotaxis protein CheW [Acidobacteriota bacterium]